MARSKPTCSANGCNRETYARGWCSMHYQRWLKHGNPETNLSPERPRGMTKAELVAYHVGRAKPDGECLLTVGTKTNGYGMTKFGGRACGIHRLVLEVELGRSLEREEYALHRCHRRACINPEHIYLGDHQQNMRDKVEAGRSHSTPGEAHWKAILTEAQVMEIRRRYRDGGVFQRELAAEYGVSRGAISFITAGSSWSHLPVLGPADRS